jgi:uncharacterized membrane protein
LNLVRKPQRIKAIILTATTNQGGQMNTTQIVAIVLIIAGALSLAYGQFSYTKETHQAKIGPIELSVKEKETVNVPVWLGGGAIALGVVLLVAGGRRK